MRTSSSPRPASRAVGASKSMSARRRTSWASALSSPRDFVAIPFLRKGVWFSSPFGTKGGAKANARAARRGGWLLGDTVVLADRFSAAGASCGSRFRQRNRQFQHFAFAAAFQVDLHRLGADVHVFADHFQQF